MNHPGPNYPRAGNHGDKESIKAQYGLDVVYRMSHNESALGPSPAVVEAIGREAVSLGDYPSMSDISLRSALAETWGRGLSPDHFFTGCSGYETIELVTRAYLKPGDEMIVSHPTFGIYNKLAALEYANIVDVPLILPDFKVDVDGILNAVTDKTRILMLCNPNNPTGTMMGSAEMRRIVQNLPEHILIISDEVYIHYVDDPDFPDTVGYITEGRPIIMINTFSKAYGLAGLRIGYAIAPVEIANYVAGTHRGFHQNRLGMVAGVAALRDQAHVQENVRVALDGKKWLYEQYDRLGLDYIRSQTNYMVLRLPEHLKNSEVVKSLHPYGVMVRSLDGPGLENTLRVSVNVADANQRFITGLEAVLNG